MNDSQGNDTSLGYTEATVDKLLREIEFLEKVACAGALDDVLVEITEYVRTNWGFQCVMVQLVDHERRVLIPYGQYGIEDFGEKWFDHVEREVPLDQDSSISAVAALRQTPIYVRITEDMDSSEFSPIDRFAVDELGLKENLIIPLVHGEKSIGVFHLMSFGDHRPHQKGERVAIEKFVQKFTGHIYAAKHEMDLEVAKKNETRSKDLMARVARCFELHDILDLLAEQIEAFDITVGFTINLIGSDGGRLHNRKTSLPSEYENLAVSFNTMSFPLESSDPIVRAFNRKQKVIYYKADVRKFEGSIFDLLSLERAVYIPLAKNGDAIGTLQLLQCERHVQDLSCEKRVAEIEKICDVFFDQIQKVLYFSELEQEKAQIRTATQRYKQMVDILVELNHLTTADQIYDKILGELLALFRFDLGTIFIEQESVLVPQKTSAVAGFSQEIKTAFEYFLDTHTYGVNNKDGATSVAFTHNCHFYFDDFSKIKDLPMPQNDRDGLAVLGEPTRFLLVPIRHQGKPIGILWMWALNDGQGLTEQEIATIETLASFIGVAISNAHMFTKVHDQGVVIETLNKNLENEIAQQTEVIRNQLEDLKKLDKLKDAFLANVSHEIRTPLNGIMGLSELALMAGNERSRSDYVEKINHSSKALMSIVNDILDFSKINAGMLRLEPEEFDLSIVLDNVADLAAASVSKKSVEVIIDCDENIPAKLIGDPLRLTQVFTNLVGNALKFTERGEVRITVTAISVEQTHARLMISVKDTGVGIAADQQEKLFESFVQADGSSTRVHGGTGLGLSISKQIVELMGGTIRCESQPGRGATFIFTINFDLPEQEKHELLNFTDLENLQVLVVEESDSQRRFLIKQLQAWNCMVVAADSVKGAEKAYEAARARDKGFHAIVAGFQDKSNAVYAFLQKQIDASAMDPADVVALVNSGDSLLTNKLEDLGIESFCFKPIKTTRLRSLIEAMADSRKSGERNMPKRLANSGNARRQSLRENLPALDGARILVVEDNEINSIVACEILKNCGMQTEWAVNGQVALDKLEEHEFDAVLMDVQMPVMDGLEATRRIKENAKTHDLPVIAMSANAAQEDRDRGMAAGMSEYLTKPLQVRVLMETLQKHLPARPGLGSLNYVAREEVSRAALPATLPGLNVSDALARLGDDEELYLQLLQRFAADISDASEIVGAYLSSKDVQNAIEYVHSIKGSAANLSVPIVHEAGANLIANLRSFDVHYDVGLVEEFFASLKQALQSISQLQQLSDEVVTVH